MWEVAVDFITGFMVGFEFLSAEETGGVSMFILDLGILRIAVAKVEI